MNDVMNEQNALDAVGAGVSVGTEMGAGAGAGVGADARAEVGSAGASPTSPVSQANGAAGESAAKPVQDLTFREGMAELDGIVSVLESNTLELEESVERYERGMALILSLQKRLDAAQQRIDMCMGEMEQSLTDEAQDTTLS